MEDNIWHTMYPWFLFQWVGNWATQTVWKVSSFLKTLGYIKSEIDHRSTLKLWNWSKMSIFQTWRMGWNGFLIYREFTRNGLHFHFVGTSLSGSKVHDVPKRPVNRPITVLFVPPPLQKKTLISQVKTLQKFETATKSSFATNLWPSMTIKPQLVLWFYAFSNFSQSFQPPIALRDSKNCVAWTTTSMGFWHIWRSDWLDCCRICGAPFVHDAFFCNDTMNRPHPWNIWTPIPHSSMMSCCNYHHFPTKQGA